MAIKNVEVSQDVGNARAVALLHALRDPSFADHLAPGESERLGGYGGKYHHELGQADAVWMVNTMAALVAVEPPGTRTVLQDDGVNPAAV